jgi:hypothetical protein
VKGREEWKEEPASSVRQVVRICLYTGVQNDPLPCTQLAAKVIYSTGIQLVQEFLAVRSYKPPPLEGKSRDKVVPVLNYHAMKTYWGVGGRAPLINFSTGRT